MKGVIEMTSGNEETMTAALPIIRPNEAALLLDCHPRTIMRMCERGELVACKAGNQWRINRAALMDYMTKGTNQEGKAAAQVADA